MHARATQGGVVLFIAMMVLLVLSLLGMIGATAAILENRMTASERNQQLARTAVMSALAEARRSKIALLQTAARRLARRPAVRPADLSAVRHDAAAPIDPVSFMQTVAAKGAAIPFGLDLAKLGERCRRRRASCCECDLRYRRHRRGSDLADKVERSPAKKARANDFSQRTTRIFRITASAAGGTSQYFAAGEVVVGITP